MTKINEDDNHDDYIEIEDESTDSPFAKAYGPELLDKRLNDGEMRLLMWLRFRCWANNKNGGRGFFKYSEIAKDLGVDPRTISNRTAVLENLGFLGSRPNGFGRSRIKTIRHPYKIYGEHLVENVFSYLKKDRTNDDIRYIKSVDLEPDENLIPEKLRVTRKTLSVDIKPSIEENSFTQHIDEKNYVNDTNIRSDLTCNDIPLDTGIVFPIINRSAPEVDQNEIDKSKVDRRIRSHSSEIPNGISSSYPAPSDHHDQNYSNGDSPCSPSSEFRKPRLAVQVDDESIDRRNTIAVAMANDADLAAAARQKLYNKQQRVSPEVRAQRTADKEKARQDNPINKPWKWTRLEKEVWSILFQDHYPGVKRSSWEKKPEGELAEKLLKDYGIDILRQAFATLFEQWHFIKKKTFPYSKDPEKWVIPDFLFFDRPEAQQFLAGIKIVKPKIPNRTNGQSNADDKKSGLW